MKKYIILLFIFAGFNAQSQITLEKEYSGAAMFAYLEGEYFYSVDYVNNQCLIYGKDHALSKTISLSVPAGLYLYEVAFVSKRIFNVDELMELLVVYYNYEALTDTSGYYYYATQVVNENGNVLLDIPDAGYSDIAVYDDGALKLMAFIYDFSTSLYATNTEVYSLPGELPSANPENPGISLQNPYPNPADDFVIIPYQTEANHPTELILIDLTGSELLRTGITTTSNNFRLNTKHLDPGQYLYYIETGGRRTLARKIVIR